MNALSPEGNFKTIPVPSRLYHGRPSSRKPLSGFRISISDSLSLNGVPTTWSSRAWSSLYTSAPNTTTDYVQKLLDLGATVVGKTKTTQFGWLGRSGEWVDEQEPWNPRGDGYQRMSGSSPGAAAALMGYEWMDHAVGDSKSIGLGSDRGELISCRCDCESGRIVFNYLKSRCPLWPREKKIRVRTSFTRI